jgi:TusA-related sulfurtransferase
MQKELKVLINKSTNGLASGAVAKSVDTRGMACPYPSFEAVKAINPLKAGEALEVITDNEESALESIPSVCTRRKWEFVVLEERKGLWKVRIKKA